MNGPRSLVSTLAALGTLAGCGDSNAPSHVLVVTAQGLQFDGPDTVSAGWTTIRFHNQSSVTHFVLVERMPEGIGLREQQDQVAPVFQEGMDLLNAGRADEALAAFGKLPAWFAKVVFLGGPGLTGPGRTSEIAMLLDPGTYLLECYVKTGGRFHSYNPAPEVNGMVHQIEVVAARESGPVPEADFRVTLSTEKGIVVDGQPQAGDQTVEIRFEDQKVYENFVGHDIHLARLSDTTDLSRLNDWMDWRRKGGLDTPSPAEFLGGFNDMPPGSSGYIQLTLEPGQYAWISEVPDPREKGLLKVFAVPPAP
jgi:hypothetical protein